LKRCRLAFLFGAGASVEAGLPTLAQLTEEVCQTLPLQLRSLFDELAATGRPPLDLVPANVEDVLTAADSLAAARLVRGDVGPRDYAFLAHEVRKRIWRRLTGISTVDYLDPLEEWFRAHRPLEIFSMNNDRVVETWCERRRIPICDGFGPDRRLNPQLFRNSTAAVQLIKLHGSVDWTEELGKGVIRSRRPYVSPPGVIPLRSPVPDVALVFPSRVKLFSALPLLDLLAWFRERLCMLDLLIVVGCQLGDVHIQNAILEGLGANPGLRILLVGPSPLGALNQIARDDGREAERVDILPLGFGDSLKVRLATRVKALAAGRLSLARVLAVAMRRIGNAEAIGSVFHVCEPLTDQSERAWEAMTDARSILKALVNIEGAAGPAIAALKRLHSYLDEPKCVPETIGTVFAPWGRHPATPVVHCGPGIAGSAENVYFVSRAPDSRIYRLVEDWHAEPVGPRLTAPGGLAVRETDAFVVEGIFARLQGLGTLRRIDLRTGSSRRILLKRSPDLSTGPRAIVQIFRELLRKGPTGFDAGEDLRGALLDQGFLSWPTAVAILDAERLVIVESRHASVVRRDSWTVECATDRNFVNLSACAPLSAAGVLLVEGGIEREGRILLWQLGSGQVEILLQPVRAVGGIAYDENGRRALITVDADMPFGEIWQLPLSPEGRQEGSPCLVRSKLHKPWHLSKLPDGAWMVTSGLGLIRLNLG